MKILSALKNRRGVSQVVSNLILLAAVIAVGFSLLFWSQSQASSYGNQYGKAIQSDSDKLRERVAFECIYYNSTGFVNVFIMNSGTIGGVSVANVYINSTSYGTPTLRSLGAIPTLISSLNATQEGYFAISLSLAPGKNCPITIITGRGSSFAATFAT